MATKVRLKVHRQAHKGDAPHWDVFEIPFRPNMNVISALMEVRKNPRTAAGEDVEPPVWEAACLEEVCGSCTMNINGKVRQACTALVADCARTVGDAYEVVLEPMRKFPLVRDLVVDRSHMFEKLIQIKGWVPIDGSFDLGMGRPQDDHVRRFRYDLSKCMTCGCCLEACPSYGVKSSFVGPQILGQTLLFNLHPVGSTLQGERLDFLTSEEGITGCGNAQNCVKACPKEVPLTRAIAQLNKDTTVHAIKRWTGAR